MKQPNKRKQVRAKSATVSGRAAAEPTRTPKAKIPPPPKPQPPQGETAAQRQRRILVEATDRAIAEARKGLNGSAAEVLTNMLREDHELFDAFRDKILYACRLWVTERQSAIRKEIEDEQKRRAAEGRALSGVPSANPPTRGRKEYEESEILTSPPRIRTWAEYPLPIKGYPLLGESTAEQRAAAERYYRRQGNAFLRRADFLVIVEEGAQAGKQLSNEFFQECAVKAGLSQEDAQTEPEEI